ncbi:hypothetical protein BJ165DRAFT_219129 [Panaeolus papilionaceus]|nr:hypothetical protein BJ165DRAFT_219129 [Panaeolus papilionaceus]
MLVGRGTWVIGGSKTRELANMAELPHHVKAEKHPYVLKLSWPEVSRPSEITILEKIEEICQEEADSDFGKCIISHVPVIEAHLDPTFPGSNTGFIRKFLFGESGVGAARQMRWIVFERFQPLSTLPEQQMVQGYVETFLCHRALWMKGVHHCDISPENLLWHPRRKAGVLNDFDLSKLTCNLNLASGPIENIGTLPFMALDLLSADGLEGKIKRLYRHDAEAFTWSLTYICLNHTLEGNKIVINTKHPLSRWFSDIDTILSSKPGILRDDWKKIEPHATAYPQAQSLAKKLVLYYLNRLSSQRRIENQASAQSDDVEFKPQRTPHLVASLGGDVAEGATSEVNPVIYKEKPDSEHFAENVWSILKWLDSEEQRLKSSLEGGTNASEYYGAKWTELSDASALLVPHSGSAHKSL